MLLEDELDLIALQELDLVGFIQRDLDAIPDRSSVKVREVDGGEVKDGKTEIGRESRNRKNEKYRYT